MNSYHLIVLEHSLSKSGPLRLPSPQVIDKMNSYTREGKTFFSFEFFPPRTPEGVTNLHERQKRMAALNPTFADITWGAGGSTADVTLDIAEKMQSPEIGFTTMMHLTCTNMPQEKLKEALDRCKKVRRKKRTWDNSTGKRCGALFSASGRRTPPHTSAHSCALTPLQTNPFLSYEQHNTQPPSFN